MRALAIMTMLVSAGASAQVLVDPDRVVPALRNFEPRADDKPLRCDVMPVRPSLDFGFRFGAGYLVTMPISQFSGPGHYLLTLTRITPQGGNGKPVYLGERLRLPSIPPSKLALQFWGAYFLGQGRYRVSWKLMDDAGRVCRKSWTVEAQLKHSERSVKMAIAPATIAELSLRGAAAARREPDDAAPLRLTVLLHAAPVSPRRTSLGMRDRVLLLGTLYTLLERVPVRSVRLVVFNLDQQKELYRRDGFTLAEMGQVARSLNELQLGLVDYHVLQNRGGHLGLLAELVNRETSDKSPADAVLILGPATRFTDRVPSGELERPLAAGPQFFYLQYRPFPPYFQPESDMRDSIASTVAQLKGKTMTIRSPGDLAKAIEQVEKR